METSVFGDPDPHRLPRFSSLRSTSSRRRAEPARPSTSTQLLGDWLRDDDINYILQTTIKPI